MGISFAVNDKSRLKKYFLTSIRVSSDSSGATKAIGPSMLEGDWAYMRAGGGDASVDVARLIYPPDRSDLSLPPELILSRLPPNPAKGITVLVSVQME